jgi:hypothetical protein
MMCEHQVSSSSFSTILEFKGINANLSKLHELSSLKKKKKKK